MQTFTSLDQIPSFKNAVITIGSFDGVHHGHRQILRRLNTLAHEHNGESIVITFEPHPRLVLPSRDNQPLRLLSTIEEKKRLLEQCGIDNLIIVPFTKSFAEQSAEDYVREFLVRLFQPKVIVIGYDHKFGKNGTGNLELLQKWAPEFGFTVEEISQKTIQDLAVSSSKIRLALETSDLDTANLMLENPYSLYGKVIKGNQLGRTIGYPTANIDIDNAYKLIPPIGIYAVKVILHDQVYGGMLYIGRRPTLPNLPPELRIEVNIFDFDQDIYDEMLYLEIIAFIRHDEAFKGLEELKLQLANDKEQAILHLSKNINSH